MILLPNLGLIILASAKLKLEANVVSEKVFSHPLAWLSLFVDLSNLTCP